MNRNKDKNTLLNQLVKRIEKNPILGLLRDIEVKIRYIRPLQPGFRPDP